MSYQASPIAYDSNYATPFSGDNILQTDNFAPNYTPDCQPCQQPNSYSQPNSMGYQKPNFYDQGQQFNDYQFNRQMMRPNLQQNMHQGYNQVTQYQNPMQSVNNNVNNMMTNFLKKTITKLQQQLRSEPNWIDMSPDGGASWKYSNMIQGNSLWCRVFTKVEVSAERKAYTKPLPHIGNITTTTKIKLNPDLLPCLQKEFPMMSYCLSTKTLQITMDSLEHCLAILSLICACQQNKMKINKIKHHKLCQKYLLMTTPGHPRYHRSAIYSLVRLIRK